MVKTAALGLKYKSLTHLQKPSLKPNLDNAVNMKSQSTLSEAFWASKDIAEIGEELFLFAQMRCRRLLMLSAEDLFLTKPS